MGLCLGSLFLPVRIVFQGPVGVQSDCLPPGVDAQHVLSANESWSLLLILLNHCSDDFFQELAVLDFTNLVFNAIVIQGKVLIVIQMTERFQCGQMEEKHPNSKNVGLGSEVRLHVVLQVLQELRSQEDVILHLVIAHQVIERMRLIDYAPVEYLDIPSRVDNTLLTQVVFSKVIVLDKQQSINTGHQYLRQLLLQEGLLGDTLFVVQILQVVVEGLQKQVQFQGSAAELLGLGLLQFLDLQQMLVGFPLLELLESLLVNGQVSLHPDLKEAGLAPLLDQQLRERPQEWVSPLPDLLAVAEYCQL